MVPEVGGPRGVCAEGFIGGKRSEGGGGVLVCVRREVERSTICWVEQKGGGGTTGASI